MSRLMDERILAEVITWLDQPDPARSLERIRGWDEVAWRSARRIVFAQGISPFLHQLLSQSPFYPALPTGFRAYLAQEQAMNAARLQRFHEDLEAILKAANQADIAVMPLKGGLLTTDHFGRPAVRPMSDLDLLVQPQEQESLAVILEKLGYARQSPRTGLAHHVIFQRPDDQVVHWEGEHPDNPRPVEVHTTVKRLLWANLPTPDLTGDFWAGAKKTAVLGQLAWVPGDDLFLAYLAIHNLTHLLIRTGRLVNWLDIAQFAGKMKNIEKLPHPDLTYPSLALAARVMPSAFRGIELEGLASRVHPLVRQWSETVTLDGRCGLYVNPGNRPYPPWRQRWERWRITQLRMVLAYGKLPSAGDYLRFFSGVIRHLKERDAREML